MKWKKDYMEGYRIDERGTKMFNKTEKNIRKLEPTWKPKKREEYYYPQVSHDIYYGVSKWEDTHKDKERLKLGLVFKTKKEATESAKKMLKIRKAIEPDKMVIDLNGDIYHDTGFEIKKVSPQGKVYWTYKKRNK